MCVDRFGGRVGDCIFVDGCVFVGGGFVGGGFVGGGFVGGCIVFIEWALFVGFGEMGSGATMLARSLFFALLFALGIAICFHCLFTLLLARFLVVMYLWHILSFHHPVKTLVTTGFVMDIWFLDTYIATIDAEQIIITVTSDIFVREIQCRRCDHLFGCKRILGGEPVFGGGRCA